jgi:putative restriction endonuclease
MAERSDQHERVLYRLGRLRVDRSTGDPAPHKPLLLLVVLELAERGELPEVLELTPQLAFRFCSYFSIVAYRRGTRPDIRLPFHFLVGDGIWTPLTALGEESAHRTTTRMARLSPELLALAHDPATRDWARRLLIAKYFRPAERAALYALVGMPVPPDEQIEADARLGERDDAQMVGRDARFRIEVVAAYDYTCALTGHRLLTIDAGSVVEAAHIHPFSDSRNNEPRNGLALTRNMHWAFDEGLWSVVDDFLIVVARDHFAEECPDGTPLAAYQGRSLRLPGDRALWPDPQHFVWHRRHRFAGAEVY